MGQYGGIHFELMAPPCVAADSSKCLLPIRLPSQKEGARLIREDLDGKLTSSRPDGRVTCQRMRVALESLTKGSQGPEDRLACYVRCGNRASSLLKAVVSLVRKNHLKKRTNDPRRFNGIQS